MIIITPFPHFLRINWTQNHFKINSKVLPLRLSNFKMFSFFSVISPSLCLVPVFQAWNLFNLIFFLTRQNPFVIYHFIFKFFFFFVFCNLRRVFHSSILLLYTSPHLCTFHVHYVCWRNYSIYPGSSSHCMAHIESFIILWK